MKSGNQSTALLRGMQRTFAGGNKKTAKSVCPNGASWFHPESRLLFRKLSIGVGNTYWVVKTQVLYIEKPIKFDKEHTFRPKLASLDSLLSFFSSREKQIVYVVRRWKSSYAHELQYRIRYTCTAAKNIPSFEANLGRVPRHFQQIPIGRERWTQSLSICDQSTNISISAGLKRFCSNRSNRSSRGKSWSKSECWASILVQHI